MTKKERKSCNVCTPKTGKDKMAYDFYTSHSVLFADGRVPVCKKCLREMMDENNIESVKSTLQIIDKPFIAKVWKSSEESDADTLGTYFRMINSFPQYKDYTWADSQLDGEKGTSMYQHRFNDVDEVEEIETENGTIALTKEIAMKFGSGYTNREYLQMEKFYTDMTMTHDINTPQLKKQLVYLSKLQIQMDRALEAGESGDFKKYSDSYEAILKSSGFRPVDRKSSSESTGLRSFGVIFDEVEKNSFVEPYPIEEKLDLVEIALREYINYIRVLSGHSKIDKVPDDIMKKMEKANGKILSESEI